MGVDSLLVQGSAYRRVATISGIPVRCDGRIRAWGGWPEDVEPILRRWNQGKDGHKLSFYGMPVWGGYATGFSTLTRKCSDCDGFFNQTNAGWLDEIRWVCDDCLIAMARASQAEAVRAE